MSNKVRRNSNSMNMEILPKNIYRCKKVHKEIMDMRSGMDYAIIELDREVLDREPVRLNRNSIARKNDRLLIMGHPMGLPLKVASNARVIKNGKNFFATNLDSFQGNSGSPVFNLRSGEVEGILVRGKADTYRPNSCYKINYCDENDAELIVGTVHYNKNAYQKSDDQDFNCWFDPKISKYITGLIAKGNIKLVADFSGVDYTSSAGLRVLLSAIKETRSQGGDMRLAGVQPDVLKVLNLSGFTSILKIFDTTDLAVASFE